MSRTPLQAESFTDTPASGDFITFVDISDGNKVKKATITNIVDAAGSQTDQTINTLTSTTINNSGTITFGTLGTSGIGGRQIKLVTAQKDSITTAPADITGLTGFTLVAGATYRFRAALATTADGTSGISICFKYTTATLTSLNSQSRAFTASAFSAGVQSTSTTDQALLVDKAAVITDIEINGQFVVNAGGTLALQVGTHTGTTTCSVYAGSLELVRIA